MSNTNNKNIIPKIAKDPILGDILEKINSNNDNANTIKIEFPSKELNKYSNLCENVTLYDFINLKPFIGKDITNVLQKLSNVGAITYINNLLDYLESFIQKLNPDINFDIRKLLPQDYYFLLLAFRNLNNSPLFKFDFICPHLCGNKDELELDLSDVNIRKIQDLELPKKVKEFKDLFKIVLPKTKLEVELQYYPVSRILIDDLDYVTVILYSIKKIDKKDLRIPDIKIILGKIPSEDVVALKERINLISNWGLEPIEFKCPKCKETVYYSLPARLNFFFPFLT